MMLDDDPRLEWGEVLQFRDCDEQKLEHELAGYDVTVVVRSIAVR